MPIRINLKEIFSSDPQEINVEKVNFNFNKLLELGVGTPGPIGTTGQQGPAGPIGLPGQQGPRGATWWVDNGVPANVTFPVGSLIDGDLYLDGTGFETWQYDLPTNTWTKVASISTAVSNYLNQSGGSPFTKDFGLNPASPDTKFITFRLRKVASPPETQRAQINAVNDILFLSNFDETLIPGLNPTQYFTALTSIYVDHDTTTYDQSRYHIELGSKFNDGGPKLSTSKNNLKIQYYREEINGSFPNLTQTQADSKFLNIGSFSLSVAPDDSVTTSVDSNGAFQFKVPKFNTDHSLGSINTPKEELSVYFAPWESMQILDQDYSHIVADGLTLGYAVSSQLNATIGIAYNYVNSSVPRLDDRDLFMIDTSTDLHGILLDDYTYINGNLNVLNKVSIGNVDPTSHLTVAGNASIGDGYKAIQAPTDGAIIEGKVGLGISAPTAKLHINNSTTENSFLVEDDTNLDSTPFVINNAGEVGIGVTSPTAKVHINNSTALNSFLVEDFAHPDSTSFVIDNDGNVGVGFGSPTAKVHINNDTSLNSFLVEDSNNTDSSPFVINNDGKVGVGIDTPIAKVHINNSTTDDSFLVEDSSSIDSSPFVINNDGKVGIGTTTPDEKLHVVGHIKMVDGNQQSAAVMTSDVNGVGSWTPFSSVGVPVGVVVSYFGNAAPAGWLICNGTTIPAGSQYDALRTHMAQFGAQNVPDLQERFIVGVGDNATAGGPYGLAAAGGGYENYLRQDQIPAHSHEMRNDETSPGAMDGPNGATVNIVNSGWHIHGMFDTSREGGGDSRVLEDGSYEGEKFDNDYNFTTQGALHTHTNADFAGHTGNGRKNKDGNPQLTWGTVNGVASATTPVNNLPPYYALLYIIKY